MHKEDNEKGLVEVVAQKLFLKVITIVPNTHTNMFTTFKVASAPFAKENFKPLKVNLLKVSQ